MIVRRLLQLLRHPFDSVFVAAPLGAFLALLAVEALAIVAGLLGMTAMHDILRDAGRHTDPWTFVGAFGAWLGSWPGSGSSPDEGPQQNRDKYDPVTKKWSYRDATYYERFEVWGIWFSQNVQRIATDIVGKDGTGSSGNAGCGKA